MANGIDGDYNKFYDELYEGMWEAQRQERMKNRTLPEDSINKALMEFQYGSYGSTKSQELLFRVTKINRVVDGDTIDVTIDLGFDLAKKERVRIAGVDTPEKRTRDKEEKALGLDATNWMKEKLDAAIKGDDELTIRTELVGGMGKYGRLLGWLYVGEDDVSLNEQMITEGYAWEYDGGTKKKDLRNSERFVDHWVH